MVNFKTDTKFQNMRQKNNRSLKFFQKNFPHNLKAIFLQLKK